MEALSLISFLTLNQWAVLAMFGVFIWMLFRGIPVAYALVGVSLLFVLVGMFVLDPLRDSFKDIIDYSATRLEYRKMFNSAGRFFGGTIQNPVLVALPMFIFMGLMLDQSGVAQRMMRSMQVLFGGLRGGLALSVMLIGIILAASTGVIGASVVLLGVMGLPTSHLVICSWAHSSPACCLGLCTSRSSSFMDSSAPMRCPCPKTESR